jgi:hypothetical protein
MVLRHSRNILQSLKWRKAHCNALWIMGSEGYSLLLEGNKSLLAERIDFRCRCEDLWVELVEVRCDAKKRIADLEAKVKFAEANSIDVPVADEKHLKGFDDEHIRD